MPPYPYAATKIAARAVIPTILGQALHGSESRLRSLETDRDMTYLQDTVNAFFLAAFCQSAVGEVTNVGYGFSISIAELSTMIQRRHSRIVLDPVRMRCERSEVLRLVCHDQKAKAFLSWTPIFSPEQGLQKVISSYVPVSNSTKAEAYVV